MKRRLALVSLVFPFFITLARPASAEIMRGSTVADVEIERGHAVVSITGKAAYGIFWAASIAMRLEDLGPEVRRARSRTMTCYGFGDWNVAIEEWSYVCQTVVGDHGELAAPQNPAVNPQSPADLLPPDPILE